MRILALETSLLNGSLSLLDADQVVWSSNLPTGLRTAQTLAPAIAQALRDAGWQPAQVQLVAVTNGPGSFTGLRVGVTTARTFAYAVGAEVIGVNTLEVIARQVTRPAAEIWAVMDAQRGDLFAARFARSIDGQTTVVSPTAIVSRAEWIAALDGTAVLAGPGMAGLESQVPSQLLEMPDNWSPRADTTGKAALLHYGAGVRDSIWTLLPQYFRPSAAEEKALDGPKSPPA